MKIKCQVRDNRSRRVRVRVIRAPLVDTIELRQSVFNRARALVL